MLFGGIPLQRYSWAVVHRPLVQTHTVLMLLLANLVLLALAMCGFAAAVLLARRGFLIAVKRVATSFARPNRA